MSAASYQLVIGNKTTSSWSLRPWLLMKRARIPFTEIRVNLRHAEVKQHILAHSPTGLIPVLKAGDLAIPDSLAIAEYLADAHPGLQLWPADRIARAVARAVSAEMHSGFRELRQHLPFAILETMPMREAPAGAAGDIRRIVALWQDCRARFGAGGPFLFGAFSIADAMYAPVASRFRTYIPHLKPYGCDGTATAYMDRIMTMAEIEEWGAGALSEESRAQNAA